MNKERLLSPVIAQELLEHVLYERVAEAIDFEALAQLEHMLAIQISEITSMAWDRALDSARSMIDRALARVPRDPVRNMHLSSFAGDDCELCKLAEQEARDEESPSA